MFAKAETFQEILIRLSVFRYVIASNCKRGRFDITKDAENFFCDLLNIVYHTNLINLNDEKENHPAIDLGCRYTKWSVQVTAENKSEKIQDTLDGFYAHKLDSQYDGLLVLLLTARKDYRKDWGKVPTKFEIKDIDDVLADIEKRCIPQELRQIEELIRKELPRIVSVLSPADSLLGRLEVVEGHPANSAKSFFDFMDTPVEYRPAGLVDINQFHEYLTQTSYRTMREFIFIVVMNSRAASSGWGDGFEILASEIMRRLGMNWQEFNDYFHELEDYRMASISEERPYRLHIYRQLKSLDFNFLFYLRKFLNNDLKKVKRVLIEGDFTLLD